jgi:hypothetical protein
MFIQKHNICSNKNKNKMVRSTNKVKINNPDNKVSVYSWYVFVNINDRDAPSTDQTLVDLVTYRETPHHKNQSSDNI